MNRRILATVACAATLAALVPAGSAGAKTHHDSGHITGKHSSSPTPTPSVSKLTGGLGVPVIASHTTFDLGQYGYQQSEYQLTGTANAYSPVGTLGVDGKWKVQATSSAPYTTRVVVNRPTNPRKFNGTVIVEWLNVSGGVDASPDWGLTHIELMRRGYAYVAVSAQAVGLDATKAADPVRYANLSHPGDSYSYDIYSQAGKAIRSSQVLEGLKAKRVIAAGESQSAARMVTYIDAVHPLAKVYDGFLVHSRSGAGSPLSQAPLAAVPAPVGGKIRTDVGVPVLVFQTETDTGALQARQPDTKTYRLWEVAGTAHFDSYGLSTAASDTGDFASAAAWFGTMQSPVTPPGYGCSGPINSGPATYVLRAAVKALNSWVASGRPPASAPRYVAISTDPSSPLYALDANGNVRGGIRTPAVDAPVARLSGLGQPLDQGFCRLFGTTTPLSTQQLEAAYHSHAGFVWAWNKALLSATLRGYLVPEDAGLLSSVAAKSDVLR